jgi:plasmid stabilization system protein ParE
MTVRFTRLALADLDAIVAYIAEDNPAAAASVRE